MTIKEFRQLKKLLELAAANSNDVEAIAAFRAASEILRRNGVTWTMAMDRVVTVVNEVVPRRSANNRARPSNAPDGMTEDEVSDLFSDALDGADGSFRDMIDSIYDQWQSTGRLSPRQWEVVRKAAGER